jgi:hypothetical protein
MSALLTKTEAKIETAPALASAGAVLEKEPTQASSTHASLHHSTTSTLSVVVVRQAADLPEHLVAWQSLAENAIEPNVFYEPWMLLPAIESFGNDADFYFVFIYAPDPLRPFGQKILCGFFPLELCHRYKKFPVPTFSLWKHLHAFLCTPLIRAEFAQDAIAAFFDWLESADSPGKLMAFRSIAGDGLFHHVLVDELNKRRRLSFISESYNRAFFKPHTTEPAIVEGMSGRHKKELRRKQNRLAEQGRLEYVALEAGDDLDTWVQEFVHLELSGWKGREGSAFASQALNRTFFEAAIKDAFLNGQLMMLALRLDGKAIAMKCNLLSGRGSFAFKIAFDECYSQFSPGVLLEMENINRLRAMFETEWMDSCAASEHFMINRLWTSRRNIETMLVSTAKPLADLLVSALPLFRWLNHKLKGLKKGS